MYHLTSYINKNLSNHPLCRQLAQPCKFYVLIFRFLKLIDLKNSCVTRNVCSDFLLKEQGMDISGSNNDCASVVPVGSFKREPEK